MWHTRHFSLSRTHRNTWNFPIYRNQTEIVKEMANKRSFDDMNESPSPSQDVECSDSERSGKKLKLSQEAVLWIG